MSDDLLLRALMKLPATELRELRLHAQAKVDEGTREVHFIDMALERKDPAGATTRPEAALGRLLASKASSTKEPIMKVVASHPSRVWMPSEVGKEIEAQLGLGIATGTIRAAMKRLVEEGALKRPQEGANGFMLASTNGSSPEPPAEATDSGSGGFERHSATGPHDDGLG